MNNPNQYTLFAEPRARAADPSTSMPAAKQAAVSSGSLENRILHEFAVEKHLHHRGLTDDELAARFPESHPPSVKTARSRLSKQGVLVDSGELRPSNLGVDMIVWALTVEPRWTDAKSRQRGVSVEAHVRRGQR